VKIVLLQNIKGLGNKYDIKNVADGYARNFLIPKGLAKIAIEKTIKEIEIQKAAWQKQEQEIKNKLEILAKELANREFKFTLKTGKKGEVYGSVTKEDIETRIYSNLMASESDQRVLREFLADPRESAFIKVNLEKPIKTLGEHQVEIDLSRGVKTKIKVIIESLLP